MQSPLVSAPQIASHLNVTLARVHYLARNGMIPCVRLGRRYRFSFDQIDEWVRNGGSPLASEKPEAQR